MITNDAVILGLLMGILALVFYTSSSSNKSLQTFYRVVPMLLLCYFLPSLLTTLGIVDVKDSQLYYVASRYLLPACLVFLTLSVDLKEIARLGSKPVALFFVGTAGVVIGGPIAILITSTFAPELVGGKGPGDVWAGLSTVAGSWIGGGANQAAMKEVYQVSDEMFSVMVTVDIIVAEVWMALLLIGIGFRDQINRFFRADSSSVDHLQNKMEAYSKSIERVPTTTDLMVLLGLGFGATAVGHGLSNVIAPFFKSLDGVVPEGEVGFFQSIGLTSSFFWLIILSTAIGVALSFTRARKLEGAGASKIGTVFIFVLVATIGMKMDIMEIKKNFGMFIVGSIWMTVHVVMLIIAAYLLRAPYFFLAIGSKANIGGAASAPVLAAAFHPSLAPVGVLLAVLGYVVGSVAATWCAKLMLMAAPVI